MKGYVISKRKRSNTQLYTCILASCAVVTGLGLLILTLKSVDPQSSTSMPLDFDQDSSFGTTKTESKSSSISKTCATVEEMGQVFENVPWKENLRVRELIRRHFDVNGAERIRALSPEQFCSHGFVLAKASEAGFGNEIYKILTAAALSIMLNRSLIIGQTRGKYPFGDYISYSHHSFSLGEVKHLWRRNGCLKTYGRPLIMRTDDFEKPAHTNVLCSNWKKWKQPIIWFQNTTDAVAAQFFLKNVHPEMKNAASALFGDPESLHSRPNVFGELMRVLVSPSNEIEKAVNWVLDGGMEPDISVHMRMLMNRPVRAVQAALTCIRKAVHNLQGSRPRVVVVSDTPSVVKSMIPAIREFAETLHFDYNIYEGNISADGLKRSDFRVKDWGPAPRWVAFVDFFLASRAKHAVVSGAHRRVGTTYAQLIAALAAANNLGDTTAGSNLSFLSSFQSNLLTEGLRLQIGWGHVWNRFAGQLSCHNQPNQCAFTPLLPPAWWDGLWQSPIPRDIRRLATYGIQLSRFGTIDDDHLHSFCGRKKSVVRTIPVIV